MRPSWILALLLTACTVDVPVGGGGGGTSVVSTCPVDVLQALRDLTTQVSEPATRELLEVQLHELSNPALAGASLSARSVVMGRFEQTVQDLGRSDPALAAQFQEQLDCLAPGFTRR